MYCEGKPSVPLLPSLWAYSRFTDADMCNSHGLTGYSLISTKWRQTIWIPKSEAEGRSRPLCVFLSGMFSAILPFLSLQNRKSPLGPGLAQSCQGTTLPASWSTPSSPHPEPICSPSSDSCTNSLLVLRSQKGPSIPNTIYINAASCMTCLTLTMNNSIRHSSSWVTNGKAETEATLGVQHRGASPAPCLSLGQAMWKPLFATAPLWQSLSRGKSAPRDSKGALRDPTQPPYTHP